ERHVVRPAALSYQRDHEDDRYGQGGAQTEVGALLGTEFAELPPVDRQDTGIHTGSSIWSGVGTAIDGEAPSSVSRKKRSSRVACLGESSKTSAPDSARARVSSPTDCSSAALKDKPPSRASWTSSIPGCAWQTRTESPSSLVRSR